MRRLEHRGHQGPRGRRHFSPREWAEQQAPCRLPSAMHICVRKPHIKLRGKGEWGGPRTSETLKPAPPGGLTTPGDKREGEGAASSQQLGGEGRGAGGNP